MKALRTFRESQQVKMDLIQQHYQKTVNFEKKELEKNTLLMQERQECTIRIVEMSLEDERSGVWNDRLAREKKERKEMYREEMVEKDRLCQEEVCRQARVVAQAERCMLVAQEQVAQAAVLQDEETRRNKMLAVERKSQEREREQMLNEEIVGKRF